MKKQEGERWLLPRFSVTRPVTVVVIFVALLVVGYIAYTRIPLEMMPSGYDLPVMGIYVPYPNATPEEIEQQITRPIEEILGTVRNVRETWSQMGRDYSWTGIIFNQGTDMDMAYAEVKDRADRVMGELPDDVERIYVRRYNIGSDYEINVALAVQREFADLFYHLDLHLARKLRRIEGVANVEIQGVQEKSFEIELNMDRVSAHRINLYELVEELRRANFAIPSGFVREGDHRFYIRAMGRFVTVDEVERLEIAPGVLLGDIASITFEVPEEEGIQRINNAQGIWLGIQKEAGANSVEVHRRVMAVLDYEFENNPNLRGIRRSWVFSQGQLIIDSLADLQETAMWAALFAVLVLFFFLRHVRMTLVITLAIPISLLATLVAMYFTGESLNLMTLMGLMVSVGLVVDNSIVVVENIFRYRKSGDEPKHAAIKGAGEVAKAVVMATLTTVVVFLPMILMSGNDIMGYLLGRIGLPVVFGLLSSLMVALIFIPLVTTRFKDKGRIGSSKVIDWVRDRYVNALRWAVGHRVEMVVLSLVVLFGIFAFTSDLGYQDEMDDTIDTSVRFRLGQRYGEIEGYPLQLAMRVEEWCRQHSDVLEFDTLSTWVEHDYVRVTMFRSPGQRKTPVLQKPLLWARNLFFLNDMHRSADAEYREFIREHLEEDIGLIPGEAEMLVGWSGGQEDRRTIRLVLEGRDYDELRRWGERVKGELRRLPDVINVETDVETGREELTVVIDRDRARTANVNPAWAAATVSNAMRGVQLPRFQERDREIRMAVRIREEDRRNIEQLGNLRVPTNDGRELPLSAIADFNHTRGPSTISHYNRKPSYSLWVTGNTERIDELMPMVAGAMRRLGHKPGYTYSFGERQLRLGEDSESFGFAAILAVTFVFLLMGVLFESFALPLTIICCVPFAFAGSQLLLKVYGMPANLFAFIGIVIIIGVVVNNGIVLVDLINRQRKKGMDRLQAISLAGHYRFRPIMMTAGTTIFSLIPLGFGDANVVGMPYNPLGLAMIGGLALNSVLTLLMVPVFYTLFDDLKKVWHWIVAVLFRRRAAEGAAAAAGARASSEK